MSRLAMAARAALVAALACAAGAAPESSGAMDAAPSPRDPVAAERAVDLAAQLRCLVCQNQSIAESNAELAVDLRRQIDEQIAAGRSDREILDFMVDRYGDFVLYSPPLKASTALLWGGPALLLLIGVVVARRVVRERARRVDEQPLSPEDRARAARLLAGDGGRDAP